MNELDFAISLAGAQTEPIDRRAAPRSTGRLAVRTTLSAFELHNGLKSDIAPCLQRNFFTSPWAL
jgi:hypothetical protein